MSRRRDSRKYQDPYKPLLAGRRHSIPRHGGGYYDADYDHHHHHHHSDNHYDYQKTYEQARRDSLERQMLTFDEHHRRDSDRRRSSDEPARPLIYNRERYGRPSTPEVDLSKNQYIFIYPKVHEKENAAGPPPPPPQHHPPAEQPKQSPCEASPPPPPMPPAPKPCQPLVLPKPCQPLPPPPKPCQPLAPPKPCQPLPPPPAPEPQCIPAAVAYQPVTPQPCKKVVKPCKKVKGTGASMAVIAEEPEADNGMVSADAQTSLNPLRYVHYHYHKPEEPPTRRRRVAEDPEDLCQKCRKGYIVRKFTWSGIIAAFICFPCGIGLCFFWRVYICTHCGECEKPKQAKKKKPEEENPPPPPPDENENTRRRRRQSSSARMLWKNKEVKPFPAGSASNDFTGQKDRGRWSQ